MATVSEKLCECGCGERTALIAKTATRAGRVKGEPNRFVYGHARGWEHPNPPARVAPEHARELKRERDARFYAKHREDVLAQQRAWRYANRERVRKLQRRSQLSRRNRERDAFCEAVDPLVVLERDDGACGICGSDVDPLRFHVDHVVPLALGGEHSYANVQTAHPACNFRKGWSL